MNYLQNFLDELRRRRVIRTTTLYVGAVWLLIGLCDVALPLLGAPDWVFPSILWACLIGLPFAAVLSWFFALAQGGIELDPGNAPLESNRSMWDVVVIGVLLGGLSVSLYFNWFGTGMAGPSGDEVSLAVLPFRDLSPEQDKAYLSEGIAEELLDRLARAGGLRVVSRRSAFALGSEPATTREIAERLNVAHIVEGSVRSVGDLVRVTVQLIDARADAARWTLTYERPIGDVFALQDQIAADVSGELRVSFDGSRNQPRRVDPQAHELLLRARHLSRQFTPEALARSAGLLEQALDLEPEFADAWVTLADVYSTRAGEGFIDAADGIARSRAAAERCLEIDPHNARALAGLGWLAMRFDNDLSRAADLLERALALNPGDADVLSTAGGLLFRLGRFDAAILLAQHTVQLDPLSSFAWSNLGVYRLYSLDPDGAIDAYRKALELSPDFVGGHYAVGAAHLQNGDLDLALESMERERDDEFRTKGRALVFHARGDRAAFEQELGTLRRTWGDVWPSEVGEVYAYAGAADLAFEWIERDIASGADGAGWAEAVLNPHYRNLHADERWRALLERLGLAPERLAAIEFRFRSEPRSV
ncbi:MAG: tetratricopeptide repeat protein [Pseudomonadales bacterium]